LIPGKNPRSVLVEAPSDLSLPAIANELFSFGPPFQGSDGLSCRTQGDCPGLKLDRAVGAGDKSLISGSFRAKGNCAARAGHSLEPLNPGHRVAAGLFVVKS
jgi:hypothetical protein